MVAQECAYTGMYPREPGRHPLEKMTSGAYLGTLMELTLKGAAKEGLFTPPCTRSVLALDGLSLSQVSAWLDGLDGGALPQRLCAQDEDKAALKAILAAVYTQPITEDILNIRHR